MTNLKRLSLLSTLVALCAFGTPALALDCKADQRPFSHAEGETCIPKDPQRIIGLHDQTVTLALVELGAPVIGSMGRVQKKDNSLYMRSVDMLFGLDFVNSNIEYVGTWDAMDFEKMTALKSDLIIGRPYDAEAREKYAAIAPTIYIDNDPKDPMAFARQIADAANKIDVYEGELELYNANIERAKFALPEANGAVYAKVQGWEGKLNIYAGYGGLTKVLADLGFKRTAFAQELSDKGVAWGEEVSAELLPKQQADYIFDTYSIAYGDSFATPRERMDEVLPTWCSVLTACAEGKYIILPRELSTGFSFKQLNMLIHLVTTNVARAGS